MKLAIAAINTDGTLLTDYQLVGELYDTRCAVGPGISAVSSFLLCMCFVCSIVLCDSLYFTGVPMVVPALSVAIVQYISSKSKDPLAFIGELSTNNHMRISQNPCMQLICHT